jgi:hypothetical protein
VIERAMQPEPSDRYPSIAEVAQALWRFCDETLRIEAGELTAVDAELRDRKRPASQVRSTSASLSIPMRRPRAGLAAAGLAALAAALAWARPWTCSAGTAAAALFRCEAMASIARLRRRSSFARSPHAV